MQLLYFRIDATAVVAVAVIVVSGRKINLVMMVMFLLSFATFVITSKQDESGEQFTICSKLAACLGQQLAFHRSG